MPIVREVPAPSESPAETAPLTAQELADETSATLARATRVLPVATTLVERYAPNAPHVLKREAAIRFGGYLLGSDYGGIAKESIGPREAEYTVNHASAFRNSGAAMLLTGFRVRRAGAISGATD